MSVLTLVTVPIGNIEDITLRALNQIKACKYILAEDSRVIGKLLKFLEIDSSSKKIFSFHEHSDERKYNQIIELMDSGEDVTLVSDAGSPIISDPAYPLIQAVLGGGHNVASCSGISAVVTALELSGLPPMPFHFHGFFPRESDKQRVMIEKIKNIGGTYIFFESPHRVKKSVRLLAKSLKEAKFAVCRELTKMYETVYRFSSNDCEAAIDTIVVKGEFVVVVSFPSQKVSSYSNEKIKHLAISVLESKGSNKSLSKLLGEILEESSKKIYGKLL